MQSLPAGVELAYDGLAFDIDGPPSLKPAEQWT